MATPTRSHSRARRAGRRGGLSRRWPLLLAGLVLAASALFALLSAGRPSTCEEIDPASREQLESVLREQGAGR